MDVVTQAVEVLRRGGLVALPTETVYGLAADAQNELAVRRIFAVKGRPSSHPLIVHLPSRAELSSWVARVPPAAQALADAFWPGPLTLVLPRSTLATDAVTGGQDTVALRVPAHPLAQAVLQAFGGGVAAPSANRFGTVSPTTAQHVRDDLDGDVELILDGGPCAVGVESTIVDLSSDQPSLLRPGGLPKEDVERVLGVPLRRPPAPTVRAPGLLPSHYAPRAGVVLCERDELAAKLEALHRSGKRVGAIAPEGVMVPADVPCFRVGADPAALAKVLYRALRELDLEGVEAIVVGLPEAAGLGLAVRDRLERASAPRT